MTKNNSEITDNALNANNDNVQNLAPEKIREQKKELRKKYLKIRDALTDEYRARANKDIFHQLVACDEFLQAETIFTYVSYKSEVDTHEIIEYALKQGKRVAVPRCVPRSREMRWHAINSLDSLCASSFGILEPPDNSDTLVNPPTVSSSSRVSLHPRTLALVPGAAFDAYGNRIGYGGGYYDVFLHDFAGVSIGLCYKECFSHAQFLTEPHDMAVNRVLSN